MKLFGLNKTLRQWLTLLAICVAGGVIFKIAYLRDVFYVPMGQAFGVNHTQLGWMMTAFAVTQTLSYLPGGWITDVISPKKLVPLALILTGTCGLWMSTFPNFKIVLLIQAIQGITITLLFWQAMLKGTRMLGNKEEQGTLFGLLEGGRGLFSTLISFLALWIFSKFTDAQLGLKSILFFYGVTLIVLGVFCYFLIEDTKIEGQLDAKGALKGMFDLSKDLNIWLAGLIVFFGYSFYNGLGYFTPYLTEIQGMSVNLGVGISVVRTYMIAIIAAPIGGYIADKLGSTIKFLVYALLIGIIFTSIYLFVPEYSNIYFVVAIMLILACIIMFIRGTYYATTNEIKVPLYLAGAATGIMSLLGNAPDLFVFTLYGKFLDHDPGIRGYHRVFLTMIAFALCGIICSLILYKRVYKNKKIGEKK